jgi:O-antigen/teichoic acid export membrane protein
LIGLGTVVFTARALTPDQLGVFAIAASVMMITSELRSFGLGGYLVRKEAVTRRDVENILGVNGIISWSLAIILFSSAPLFSNYYGIPDIKSLIWILSIPFFFSPYASVWKALLLRDFRFGRIFYYEMGIALFQLGALIFFVETGHGYFSIAYSSLVGEIVGIVLLCSLTPTWRFITPRIRDFKQLFSFGVFVTLSNVFRRVVLVIPDLVLGKLGSTSQVAYFSRAVGFLDFLFTSLSHGVQGVAAPYLASEKRRAGNMQEAFLKANKLISAVTLPAFVLSGCLSTDVILVVFGEQWGGSAPLVKGLSLWFLLRYYINFFPSLMVTMGCEKQMFFKELLTLIIAFSVVLLCFQSGLEVIAWGLAFLGFVELIIMLILLKYYCKFKIYSILESNIINLLISIICGVISLMLKSLVPEGMPVFSYLPLIVFLVAIVWGVALWVVDHPLYNALKGIYDRSLGGINA